MTRWKNALFNITVAINCLLCFLLLFESRLVIPPWLQVTGRMHPLVIHFPIVLLILFIGQRFLLKQQDNTLLLLTALTAAITATMGLLLSKEPGYDSDALTTHKWSGIFLSFLTLAWYTWSQQLQQIKWAPAATAALALVLLTFAGHQGATITHGQNFLLAPVITATPKKTVALEEAIVFNDMVQPILKSKCMNCHNSNKAKGELVMETANLMLKGGKTGPLYDSTRADFGLLMQRIHLAPDEEKHMPPRGKPQLTDEEFTILYQWLKHDPTRNIRVADLPQTDTLRMLAANLFKNSQEEEPYDFTAADEAIIQKLNTSYRIIYPVALHSPALNVDFYSPQAFKGEQLKALEPLGKQIVSLDLDKMPVTDADIPAIMQFSNLRVLNLAFTGVTGAGIAQLCKLEKLKSLSLSGTAIKADDIACLTTKKNLRHLYVWNTAIPPADLPQAKNAGLVIEGGSRTDTMMVKLNAPILLNDSSIVFSPTPLRLKHYVPGAIIRYTLDGSDPDSSNAIVYDNHAMLTGRSILRARAFKKGWLPSDDTRNNFYSEKFKPDSIRLLQPIDSNYMKFGAKTLIDLVKGDAGYGSGKWLGFHKNKMDCLLYFKKPIIAADITLSGLVDIGSEIMPPVNIEVWGGPNPQNLKLLGHLTPEQPEKAVPGYLTGYDISFNPMKLSCIRITVTPVDKLPLWHPAKGKKGWIFFDEIFVN
jgi:Planctomycete cytochrome C/Fn3 associated